MKYTITDFLCKLVEKHNHHGTRLINESTETEILMISILSRDKGIYLI